MPKREQEGAVEDLGKHGQEDPEGSSESASEESEMMTTDSDEGSWVNWFMSLKGNEYFVEVDEEYIQDDFNLTGLNSVVPHYDYAIDMILDNETEELTDGQYEIVAAASEMLYGLIHARYILTTRGLSQMLEKYQAVEFGRCPRVYCQGQPLLPVGQSDLPQTHTVKLFCCRCQDIYHSKLLRHTNLDGAYFGTTFPHLFFQTYPEFVPYKPTAHYAPRIFGFKIHKSSLNYPKLPPKAAAQSNGPTSKENNTGNNKQGAISVQSASSTRPSMDHNAQF